MSYLCQYACIVMMMSSYATYYVRSVHAPSCAPSYAYPRYL